MIVSNLKDKIYILVEAEDQAPSTHYTITPINSNGCLDESKARSGDLLDNQVELSLPDGRYLFSIYNEEGEDFEQVLTVFYNYLPYLIRDLQDLVCPCSNCQEKNSEETLEVFFKLVGFLQQTGLVCSLSGFKNTLSKYFGVLQKEEEYARHYGEFVFDYKKNVLNTLVYTYIDLYQRLTNQPQNNQEDLDQLNDMLKVDIMERCLYKLGYDFQDIVCEINKSKCNCDEL